jgi:hypothetical protein
MITSPLSVGEFTGASWPQKAGADYRTRIVRRRAASRSARVAVRSCNDVALRDRLHYIAQILDLDVGN